MKSKKHYIFNPLTLTGLAFVLLAIVGPLVTLYLIFLAVAFLATGVFAIWLSWPIRVYAHGKMYYFLQYGITTLIIGGWGLSYLHWDASTKFVLPENHPDSILIVYGIEEYPPLPAAFFWKRSVQVPESGIIVTSSKEAEKRIKIVDHKRNTISYNAYDWNANGRYPCILTDNTIHYWVLSFGDLSDYNTDTILELANRINKEELSSAYQSDSLLSSHNGKTSLYLQGNNLPSLPNGLAERTIHFAYLTGNNFDEIPSEVLKMDSLENLYLSNNNISFIDPEISQLTNLRYLSLNGNPINHADTNSIKALLPNCKINFN